MASTGAKRLAISDLEMGKVKKGKKLGGQEAATFSKMGTRTTLAKGKKKGKK